MVKGLRKGVVTPLHFLSIVFIVVLSACSIQKAQKTLLQTTALKGAHVGAILGVNIGANKDSEDFVADYVTGVTRFGLFVAGTMVMVRKLHQANQAKRDSLHLIGIGTGNPDHLTRQAILTLNRAELVLIPRKGRSKSDLAELRRSICAAVMPP